MPGFALTAEEIAAQIAAEQAAAAAAEATAQAAAQAAAEAAAQEAARQAAIQAAQQTAANAATNQSILQATGAGGAPATAAQMGGYGGINSLGAGAGAGAGTGGIADLGMKTLADEVGAKSGVEQLVNAANYPLPQTPVPEVVPPAPPAPPATLPAPEAPVQPTPPIEPGGKSLYDANGIATGNPSPPPNTPADVTPGVGQSRVTTNPADLTGQPTPFSDATSGIKDLFSQGLDFAKKNPLSVAMGANALATYLNKPEPYEKPKYKSTWNGSAYTGYTPVQPTPYQAHYAHGGIADLGSYSDGGRMLKGPGDGMSDNIPATIAGKQPARLANEEFVIPADVVSHLGNGSSEAGAKQLYKMMDRVRQARTGTKKQGKQINPKKYLA
jgi:hypothetical protein